MDAVPRGRELLALLESLTRCDDGDEATRLLHQLFVGHLRFETHAVEETGRLDSNQVLRRLRTVARHEAFVVSLLELSFPYEYPSTFQPVFRLHPYGLVVAIAPGWNTCQFAFRVKGDDASVTTRTRPLVGKLWDEALQDTLVVWLRRLELLRPRGADSPATLLERVEAALGPSPAEIVGNWSSIPVDTSAPPPGPSWRELPAHERRAFLQDDTVPGTPRCFWGLERVLRASFPMGVSNRRARICYRGYVLGEEACSAEDALRTGKSWVRRASLELEARIEDGTSFPVVLPVAVPEVSREGHLLLDGTWYRFVPRVSAVGRLLGSAISPAEFEAEDEEESEDEVLEIEGAKPAELAVGEEQGAFAEFVEVEPLAAEEDASEETFTALRGGPVRAEGGSLAGVLEAAAARKLASVRKRIKSWVGEPHTLKTELPSMLRGLVGRDPELLLVSRQFLRLELEPMRHTGKPEDELPVLRHVGEGAEFAPAWACPDVSAALPPGTWLPVAAARLAPGGELAVPVVREAGALRLAVEARPLWKVNPRTGASGGGPPSWWIASELATFALLPAGRLEGASAVATRARVLPSGLRALRVPGERLRGRFRQGLPLPPRSRKRRILHARIPAVLREDGQPQHRLLCAEGRQVRPGQVWLEAPPALWGARTAPAEKKPKGSPLWNLLAQVFHPEPSGKQKNEQEAEVKAREATAAQVAVRQRAPGSLAWQRWTIPPGLAGIVVEVVEREERDRYGLCLGWRVTLVVAPEETEALHGHVVLADGRVIPLEGAYSEEDAPFMADGTGADLLIEDPHLMEGIRGASPWRDGRTGEELSGAAELTERLHLLASSGPLLRGPDLRLRFRVRDGAGIPASSEAPALSTVDWTWWSAADPAGVVAVAQVARAWSGGLPPYWPHLVEVLEAADVLPPVIPAEGDEGTRSAAFAAKPPPSASQIRRTAATYRDEKETPLRWSCACGRLTGVRRAHEVCASLDLVGTAPAEKALPDDGCGTPVLLRAALSRRRRPQKLPLTEPVLHPWRLEAAAALLGLTCAELLEEHARSGATRLALRFAVALREEDPTAAARARLAEVEPAKRVELVHGLELLRAMRDAGTLRPHRFLLARLSVLPRALQPTGLPPGAPTKVQSALTRAYQDVHAASRLLSGLKSSGVSLLVRTARRTLQEKVRVLFGSPWQGVVSGEPRSLAELTARLWPLTRPPRLRSVIPGTFWVDGVLAEAGEPAKDVLPEPGFDPCLPARATALAAIPSQRDETSAENQDPGKDEPVEEESKSLEPPTDAPELSSSSIGILRLRAGPLGATLTGVFTAKGPRLLPGRPLDDPQPDRRTFWMRRAAKERLIRLHLPRLMGLFAEFGAGEEGEVPAQQSPSDRGRLGAQLLRALVRALDTPRSNPAALCALLEASRPLPLENDGQRALERVSPALVAAFPGQGAMCAEGRAFLAEALVGWWTRAYGTAEVGGWVWMPVQERGPAGARRMLPPLSSPAWETWPGMTAATAPVRFLLSQEGQPVTTAWGYSLQVVLGLDVEPLAATADEAELPSLPLQESEDVLLSDASPFPEPVEWEEEVSPAPPLSWPAAQVLQGATEDVTLLDISLASWLSRGAVQPPDASPRQLDVGPGPAAPQAVLRAGDITLLDRPFLNWLRGDLNDG
ncbi:hypothetical protein ACN28I_07900 [Archangium gephyra]|uniref:hypothetical protein n=1 Tax=Archangium gephyra TaxID=48 RepID=UPI003B7937A4